MNCERCNSENTEFINNKKMAGGLFMLGVIFFPLFFIFWPMAIARLFSKDQTFRCKECRNSFIVKEKKASA